MRRRTTQRKERPGWFEFGLGVFAVGIPVGAVVLLMAPIEFIQMMGAAIVITALLGTWVCAVGLKLERPSRWDALLASFGRREHRTAYRVPR